VTTAEDVPGVDLAIREPTTSMVVAGTTPQEILENAARIAGPLKELIETQGLYTSMGTDKKTGKERRHVDVSGWQAAGAMLGALGGMPLAAHTVWARPMHREDGVIAYEAHVEIRTLNGDVVSAAEAMCSNGEDKRRSSDEYAIRSMAETRAESRAYRKAIGWIISLAGFSPTPAEEMRGEGTIEQGGPARATPQLPDWAAPMNDIPGVAHNLTRILKAAGIEETHNTVTEIGNVVLKQADGTFPFIAARVVGLLANAVETKSENLSDPDDADVVEPTTNTEDAA